MTAELQVEFLQRIAIRYTTDVNEANDLVQDTMYKAIKKKHLFREGTNRKAWLATIMKNNFINTLRKKKRTSLPGDILELPIKFAPKVNNDFARRELKEDIEKAFKSVDPMLSEPLKMSLEGFAYEEIADKFQVPLGTIKSRIFHGRKKIQLFLSHHRDN